MYVYMYARCAMFFIFYITYLSCKSTDPGAMGCSSVTGWLPADIKIDIDSDREMERIHSLFFDSIEKLENLQGKL